MTIFRYGVDPTNRGNGTRSPSCCFFYSSVERPRCQWRPLLVFFSFRACQVGACSVRCSKFILVWEHFSFWSSGGCSGVCLGAGSSCTTIRDCSVIGLPDWDLSECKRCHWQSVCARPICMERARASYMHERIKKSEITNLPYLFLVS